MSDYPKAIVLPSGRKATLTRKIKVRDSVYARRVAGAAEADNELALSLAAFAPTVELDGKPALYEDLLELDIDDMEALGDAASFEKKITPTPLN